MPEDSKRKGKLSYRLRGEVLNYFLLYSYRKQVYIEKYLKLLEKRMEVAKKQPEEFDECLGIARLERQLLENKVRLEGL